MDRHWAGRRRREPPGSISSGSSSSAIPTWDVRKFNFDADIVRAEEADGDTHQRARSESEAVHRSRRQADSVSRLERSADFARQQRAVLRARRRGERRRRQGPGVVPALHGARAWGTAAAARDRTRSTCSPRSSSGSRQGKAPDQIVASHATDGRVDRTRPLCPYPQVAVYKGSGSIDEAASFSCRQE